MYIQVEDTPNPQSLKFIADRPVLGEGELGVDFPTPASAEMSPLAAMLFDLDGVAGVYLGADFVTITKAEGADWTAVKAPALGVISDFLVSGMPALNLADNATAADGAATSLDDYEGEDREVVEQIIELIDTRVRPAVAADGRDRVFRH